MKKLLLLTLTIFIASLMNSCRQDLHLFQLDGDIKGLSDSTISIYGIFNDPDSILVIPVNQGKFSYTLSLDTITPLFLLFNEEKLEYPIFADKNTHILIKGDTTDMQNLSITGGIAQEEYNEFAQSIKALTDYHDIRLKADSFIVAHPHSIVSVYLIYEYFVKAPSPDKNQIENICKQLSGNMQDNPYISRLLSTLEAPGKKVAIQHINIANLVDTTGVSVKINDYNNHYIVLSFWASWHPESRLMQDSLQANIKRFAKRPVKFINVSLDSDRDQWLKAIRTDKLGGIHLCDFKGWNGGFVQSTNITSLPKNMILNHTKKLLISDKWGDQLDNYLNKELTKWEEQQKKQATPKKSIRKNYKNHPKIVLDTIDN